MSTLNELTLHGHRVCFRSAGEGPLVVLIHGITGRSNQWEPAIEHLARDHEVLAPDLLGHGESAKPRGDYSLGAYASARARHDGRPRPRPRDGRRPLARRRDRDAVRLPVPRALRAPRARLVSGGLGREVHPLLRASTLPGAEWVMPWLMHAARARRGRGRRPADRPAALAGRDRPRRGRARLRLARRRRGPRRLHRDHARRPRPGRPAGLGAGPPLPHRGAAIAAGLGLGGSDHPRRPRPRRPRADAGQPPGAPGRRRPLPAARAAPPLRRAAEPTSSPRPSPPTSTRKRCASAYCSGASSRSRRYSATAGGGAEAGGLWSQ